MTPYEELKVFCNAVNECRGKYAIASIQQNYVGGEYNVDMFCRRDLINEFHNIAMMKGLTFNGDKRKAKLYTIGDLHIYVFTDLIFGLDHNVNIGTVDHMVEGRRVEDGLYYISHEDEVIYVFLHALYRQDNLVANESWIMGTKRHCDERHMISAIGTLIAKRKPTKILGMMNA